MRSYHHSLIHTHTQSYMSPLHCAKYESKVKELSAAALKGCIGAKKGISAQRGDSQDKWGNKAGK